MIRLEISLRGVLTIIGVLLGFWLLWKLWPVLLLVIVSLMLAASLLPFFEWLVRHCLSRALAALTLAILLVATLALIGLIVIPAVISQVRTLIDQLPELRQSLARMLMQHRATTLAAQVQNFNAGQFVKPNKVADTGRRIIEVITAIVTVVFLTLYILLDARRLDQFVFFAVPNKYHDHLRNVLPALQKTVGAYIRGQVVTSAAITVFTFVVLWFLGVPNAISLAVLAGITDIIPMVGGLLAVLPATLAALTQSVGTGILVAILLIAYQEFENRVIVPRIYGATMRLPTVVVFVALLIGAKLAGIIGALLSLPVAAGVRVIVEYIYDVRTGHPLELTEEDELFAPDMPAEAAEPVETGASEWAANRIRQRNRS